MESNRRVQTDPSNNTFIEKKIRQAGETLSTSLYLNFCHLETIPDSVFQLEHLQHLDLRGNRISVIPPGISKLTRLKGLYLSQNHIRELPEELFRLTSIHVLKLDNNRLRELPDQIGKMENLRYLYANDNHIGRVSPSVFDLKELKGLHLNENRIREIPGGIGRISRLEVLDLSGNRLDRFPDDITMLPHLRVLSIRRNRLFRLPETIGNLAALVQLDAGLNRLEILPAGVSGLKCLRKLCIDGNRLRDLSEELYNIPHLQELDASRNRLRGLSPRVSQLDQLYALKLENNRIMSLPVELFSLRGIRILDISGNRITELPREAGHLENLEYLFVDKNPLEIPPPEIVAQGIDTIRQYYTDLENDGEELVYRARLMMIGPHGSGKTSLAEKLMYPNYQLNPQEKSTRGVSLKWWHYTFSAPAPMDFNIVIWEFDGRGDEKFAIQSAHHYLMARASLFVLVLDDRPGDIDMHYWLNLTGILALGNPVLVVVNRKNASPPSLPLHTLENIQCVAGIMEVNLSDNTGLGQLAAAVRRITADLEHVGRETVPRSWMQIWKTLEREPRDFINRTEFYEICREHGVGDPNRALHISQFLHDLRVILHFQRNKTLRRTLVLNPMWMMKGIFLILSDEKVREKNGIFDAEDMARVWSGPAYNHMHECLLHVMLEFEICFPVYFHEGENAEPGKANSDSGSGNIKPPAYAIPVLLPVKPRDVAYFKGIDSSDLLNLHYHYTFMPPGITSRLLVRLHAYIFNEMQWRSGMVLKMHEALVEIREFLYSNRLTIRVSGTGRQDAAAVVRKELQVIHDEYDSLEFMEMLPCSCNDCRERARTGTDPHLFSRTVLENYTRNGRYKIVCPISTDDVDIRGLLDGTLGSPKEETLAQPRLIPDYQHCGCVTRREKIVVFYSGSDTPWLVRVQTHLQTLKMTGIELEIWDDNRWKTSITAGEDVTLMLGETKIAILLVTANFLASHMISRNQLPPLLETAEKENALVLPLIVKPCRFSGDKNLSQFSPFNNPDHSLIDLPESEQEKLLVHLTETIEKSLSEFS